MMGDQYALKAAFWQTSLLRLHNVKQVLCRHIIIFGFGKLQDYRHIKWLFLQSYL